MSIRVLGKKSIAGFLTALRKLWLVGAIASLTPTVGCTTAQIDNPERTDKVSDVSETDLSGASLSESDSYEAFSGYLPGDMHAVARALYRANLKFEPLQAGQFARDIEALGSAGGEHLLTRSVWSYDEAKRNFEWYVNFCDEHSRCEFNVSTFTQGSRVPGDLSSEFAMNQKPVAIDSFFQSFQNNRYADCTKEVLGFPTEREKFEPYKRDRYFCDDSGRIFVRVRLHRMIERMEDIRRVFFIQIVERKG
jgi:hypothetical protein